MIHEFFEIFNFRFWLLLFEMLLIPMGFFIGGLYILIKEKVNKDESQ